MHLLFFVLIMFHHNKNLFIPQLSGSHEDPETDNNDRGFIFFMYLAATGNE